MKTYAANSSWVSALRIAIAYVLVAGLYIAISDELVLRIGHHSPQLVTGWQAVKGLFFVLVTGGILFLVLLVRGRREKRWREGMIEARESFEILFERAPVALFLYDVQSLQIIECNNAAERLYGTDTAGMRSRKLSDLHAPDDIEPLLAHLSRSGDEPYAGTGIHCRASGAPFHVSLIVHPMVFRDRPCRLVAVTDLSAEEQLERARAAADSARLEAQAAKAAFLSRISHEMRTPMNSVMGFLEVVENEADPKLRGEYLAEARASAAELMGLLDRLIGAAELSARPQVTGRSRDRFLTILEKIAAGFAEEAARKGITLRTHVTPEVPPILSADVANLSELLGLIVGNALKFSFEGEVLLSVEPGGEGEVVFSVTDEGIGLRPGEEAKIFALFYQADQSPRCSFGGLGLGLAVAKQLGDLIGATIELGPPRGKGCSFLVKIHGNAGEEGVFEAS